MTIPYTFAGATTAIPLAQLDANFASPITLGNVAMTLSNTYTSIGNLTLTNVTVSSGNVAVTNANVTTLTATNDASISGLTVGKGGGAVSTNTALGNLALSSTNTGVANTGVGYAALLANTSGQFNTAVGASDGVGVYGPLRFNTTGGFNIAVGSGALGSNTTASYSTAMGFQAGYTNSTGRVDAIGSQTLFSNTTGVANIGIGGSYIDNIRAALYGNTTGSYNTAVGNAALAYNTTNSNNTALGYQAGYSATATGNTFIGYQAGQAGAGNYNVIIGHQTALNSTSDSFSILISGNSSATGKGSSTGFIQPGGGGVYQGNNQTLWSITSDQRLKKNIVDNNDGLDKILQIKVRNFEYRTKDEVTELEPQNAINIKGVQLGAIAQELQAILPDCVKTESTGVMSVDASNLNWYLVNAIKELNAKITALENK